MKFLRFLCNVLMFIGLVIGISVIQISSYDVLALQSENIAEIKISASSEEDITFLDNYSFWVEDIGENLKAEPKYRIRNWASWSWWKNGMEWADKCLDTVIAITKPIFVPVAQVNAINNYHAKTINDFEKYLLTVYKDDTEALNNALYEVYVIYERGYGEAYVIGSDGVPISEHIYTGSADPEKTEKAEYARWVKRNGKLYNTIWKLKKYNTSTYEKYFKKFISYETVTLEDGRIAYTNRNIKAPVVVIYYQQVVSVALALAFTIKYPIALAHGRFIGRSKQDESL